MTPVDSETVLGWLKAAGEDSRLRLLALCARQELSVSDLAEALRQSEPRVSRHLRILCEAGLLERLRQGQWVHYRLTRDAAAAAFVQGLLGQVDRKDRLFTGDQARAARRGSAGAGAGVGGVASGGGARVGAGVGGLEAMESRPGSSERASESRLGRALKGFVDAVDAAVSGGDGGREGADGSGGAAARGEGGRAGATGDVESVRTLVVGVEHLELLEAAATSADECVAIAHSRRAAQSARAFAERRGFVCRVLLAASSNALCEKDLEAAGVPFDVVYLDHLSAPDSPLEGMLKFGRRGLASSGRLWLFERYESLESPREKVVEHPIGRLRRMLGEVGLTCERLSPIEAEEEHVLAAVALPAKAASRGTVSAA
jgi:DNA-binding transcriptional ArsR family regulator